MIKPFKPTIDNGFEQCEKKINEIIDVVNRIDGHITQISVMLNEFHPRYNLVLGESDDQGYFCTACGQKIGEPKDD